MGYRIRDGETVSEAIKRITLEQIDRAQDRLLLKGRNKERAVHEARVCFKKIRAMLRLARGVLGEEIFRAENAEYRDLGRRLSTSRDTAVVAGALEEMIRQFNKPTGEPDVKWLRRRLRRARVEQQLDKKHVLTGVAHTLTSARRRVATWPAGDETFVALSLGLRRVYKNGREGLWSARAQPTAENLHEWRKQVKYLLYQVTLLNAMWPRVLDALARELNKLADCLSENHDLVLLRRSATEEAQLVNEREDMNRLIALIENRRAALESRAFALGARIYAERSGAFVGRLQSYWECWRPYSESETPVNVSEIGVVDASSPSGK
jgi:CHAD domain-containing protein